MMLYSSFFVMLRMAQYFMVVIVLSAVGQNDRSSSLIPALTAGRRDGVGMGDDNKCVGDKVNSECFLIKQIPFHSVGRLFIFNF